MYRTFSKEDNECINHKTLPYFVEALSKTKLKQTIKNVHVREEDYRGLEVQYAFNDYKFRVTVKGDEIHPKIKKTVE